MIMRSIYPNYGGITIEGKSVLNDFKHASKHLGVVTQHNTLWDKLTCRDHLRLFARLRGVPAAEVDTLVNKTVKELELGPYAHRLAGALVSSPPDALLLVVVCCCCSWLSLLCSLSAIILFSLSANISTTITPMRRLLLERWHETQAMCGHCNRGRP
jgi:hypothetical protein